jgi:HEAT repeat protein
LRSTNANEVAFSLFSIEHLGQAAKGALSELIHVLTNPPPTAWLQTDWLREHAAPALASLGTNAAPAIPILKQLFLAETNHHVRTSIASALSRIDPNETTALVTVFEEMTRTNTPQAREATARFLGNLGASATNTAPLLIGMLTDTNLDVTCAAAGALRKMGAVKAAVKEPLAKQLTDHEEEIRFHAAKTLVQFDPADPDALNVFIEIIRKRSNQSAAAIQELGTLGPSARLAIPVLREASHSDDRYVRGSATWALSSIESTQGPQ